MTTVFTPATPAASFEAAVRSASLPTWPESVTTPELASDKVYTYEVRAKWTQNGREFDQTRTVTVQPGAQVVFAFFPEGKEELPAPVEKIQ